MNILKVQQSILWLPGHFLYFLLLLIVSNYTPWFQFPYFNHEVKLQWSWSWGYMQCGIDPKGSFISSCSFMCHRLLCSLFLQVSTSTLVPLSLVCMSQVKLQSKLESHTWPLISYHLFLQSQLSKLLMLLFAICHSAMAHYNNCWAWLGQFSKQFLVLCC